MERLQIGLAHHMILDVGGHFLGLRVVRVEFPDVLGERVFLRRAADALGKIQSPRLCLGDGGAPPFCSVRRLGKLASRPAEAHSNYGCL